MLTLYQFPGPWDVCSASPFCAKLEAFLRWQGVPYQSVTVLNLKGAPKGKLPYIEDEQGKLSDSNFIIKYLTRTYHLTPDAGLGDDEKAAALAFRYLCEESLYWALVWLRWADNAGWNTTRQVFFREMPEWKQSLVTPFVRTYVRKQLQMQGMGRHTREEVLTIACANLRALSDFLHDKKYFFGARMTMTDIVVFSLVANFLTAPFANPVTRYLRRLGNLVAHTERVRERCFGVAKALPGEF